MREKSLNGFEEDRERKGGRLFIDDGGFVVVKEIIGVGFLSKFFGDFFDNREEDVFFCEFYYYNYCYYYYYYYRLGKEKLGIRGKVTKGK